jgi:hypothetical protein
MLNRKGMFKLQHELIRSDFDLARTILSTVIVIRAENCFITDKITYWAYSEHFDEIDARFQPPEYEAILTGRDKIEWRRVE